MDNARRRSGTARLSTGYHQTQGGKVLRSGLDRKASAKANPAPKKRKVSAASLGDKKKSQSKPVLVLPETGQILSLTAMERVALRRRAHGLVPVVLIGQAGLTDAVLLEIERALRAHELIKVKAGLSEDKVQRDIWIRQITERLSAANVQQIGKTLVLYRPR